MGDREKTDSETGAQTQKLPDSETRIRRLRNLMPWTQKLDRSDSETPNAGLRNLDPGLRNLETLNSLSLGLWRLCVWD